MVELSPAVLVPSIIHTGHRRLACVHTAGKLPGVFFLGGFNSTMQGLKAQTLENFCREHGTAFTRFDYSGHGESPGKFEDGYIGAWLEDALGIFDHFAGSAQIVVGSSMGAWIGLLLAQQRQQQVQGFIGIAGAYDFTLSLASTHLNATNRAELAAYGITTLASTYDSESPYIITKKLIEESRQHGLLDDEIVLPCSVHLIHGFEDHDINWQYTARCASQLLCDKLILTLIRNGDHRLSDKPQLNFLKSTVGNMLLSPV